MLFVWRLCVNVSVFVSVPVSVLRLCDVCISYMYVYACVSLSVCCGYVHLWCNRELGRRSQGSFVPFCTAWNLLLSGGLDPPVRFTS